jgi:hypothetical protein
MLTYALQVSSGPVSGDRPGDELSMLVHDRAPWARPLAAVLAAAASWHLLIPRMVTLARPMLIGQR